MSSSESESARILHERDEKTFKERQERLQVLLSQKSPKDKCFEPLLVMEYSDDAGLCWIEGAFAAAVIMTRLAFEALLAYHYRCTKRYADKRAKMNDLSFSNLIEQAETDGLITKREALVLHELREACISCVQVHDPNTALRLANDGKGVKICGEGAADIAKKSIKLLITLLPKMVQQLGIIPRGH